MRGMEEEETLGQGLAQECLLGDSWDMAWGVGLEDGVWEEVLVGEGLDLVVGLEEDMEKDATMMLPQQQKRMRLTIQQ